MKHGVRLTEEMGGGGQKLFGQCPLCPLCPNTKNTFQKEQNKSKRPKIQKRSKAQRCHIGVYTTFIFNVFLGEGVQQRNFRIEDDFLRCDRLVWQKVQKGLLRYEIG